MNDGTSEGCVWGIETEDVVAREWHLKGPEGPVRDEGGGGGGGGR